MIYGTERLAVSPILKFDFCNKNIKFIWPYRKFVEQDDGTTEHVYGKHSCGASNAPLEPSDVEYEPMLMC